MDRVHFLQAALAAHDEYWDQQRPVMQRLRDAYLTKFYEGQPNTFADTMIRIETADAYAYVESTVGSLFTQSPGVEIQADVLNPEQDPDVAEEVVNRFLQRKREALEEASKLALIYPCSFLKLAPRDSSDPLERVDIRAIEPWNVVVDQDADSWNNQRFVAHIYWLPLPEAKSRFPDADFKAVPKEDFLCRDKRKEDVQLPEDFLYVKIVEMYDLVHDELIFWSPDHEGGRATLSTSPIPVRDWDDSPLPAIVPFYFSRVPGKPLEGYSSLARVYDQIVEKNYARTRMANNVRRDARMFLVKKDVFDDQALALIATGQDGTIIPIESDNLGSVLAPVPVPTVNSDHQQYLAEIQSDLDRGTLMAPFTRGEATKTTATEVLTLQSYTASEIGRLARNRDESIERLANLYLRLLVVALADEKPIPIRVHDEPKLITPQVLGGKFNIAALDGANTPVGDYLRQNALLAIGPQLVQLGADPQVLREEMVKAYRLPNRLAESPAPQPQAPEVETTALGPLTEAQLELMSGKPLGPEFMPMRNK